MIHLTIDGKPTTVAPGTTIWTAARQLGIDIPVLCHSPRMEPVGVCRLCVVDVGSRVLPASCVRQCEDGMIVATRNERVEKQRRGLLSLLLADHPTPCTKEKTTADCDLEALARQYGILNDRSHPSQRPTDRSSKVIAVDHSACILCDRCIRACDDIQSNEVIGRTGKGHRTWIGFDLDRPMGESTCVSCGECAAACPTGALAHKPITLPLVPRNQTKAVDSICPYCGVGCTTTYYVRDNCIVSAEGRDSPGSAGRLCVKGRYGWDYAMHPQRLTKPLIRRLEFYPKGPLSKSDGGDGHLHDADVMPAFREASWDEALDLIANRLKSIKETHGPRCLAGFGSAKCSNEEAYLFQKLMRAALERIARRCSRIAAVAEIVPAFIG